MAMEDPNNRISFDPPPDKLQVIEGLMSGLEQALADLGADLGTENRRKFARAGDGSHVYMKKALVVAQTMPQLCPSVVDPVEFARDVAGADYYDATERRLLAMARRMHDGSLLCRHEGYRASNAVYDGAKTGAEFNVPGAKAVADDLGKQFEAHRTAASKRARKRAKDDGSTR